MGKINTGVKMITSTDILKDQKVLINKMVTVYWDQGTLRAQFDPKTTDYRSALLIIEEYLKILERSLG